MQRKCFAVCLLAALPWGGAEAFAQQGDAFPPALESEIGGRKVKLVMTGQAVRKKAFFSVYAVAGYIEEGVKVRTAEDLVAVDCAKRLHLIMLRTVSGADMTDSMLASLRQNHPAPAFAEETKMLADKMRSSAAEKGDHILITHVPNVGLHFKRMGGEEIVIRNVAFSRAVWDIYLGRHNVSEDVKRGLLSALAK